MKNHGSALVVVILIITNCIMAYMVWSTSQSCETVYKQLQLERKPESIVAAFENLYYTSLGVAHWSSKSPNVTKWFGVPMDQLAFDNQVVQEIFWDLKPDVVIEAGTWMGGSALYYATILDAINPKAKIITIDINPCVQDASRFRLFRDHVICLKGMSTDPKIVEQVRKLIPPGTVVYVTLDSDHRKDNVLKELNIYSKMVTVNSYIVCQDTNINGHPIADNFGPGPFEAVEEFLKTNHDFVIDHSKEKYLASYFPSGFLKRIR